MFHEHPAWVLRQVQRFVPLPHELFDRVYHVFSTFGPMKDAKQSSLMLFNDEIWKIAKSILENICCGYYSDPHGIALYYTCGRDKYDLMWYQCVHGTNVIEGGVHQNI